MENTTGDFLIRNSASNEIKIQAVSGEQSIVCNANGSTDLYYDGGAIPKFETTSTGAKMRGTGDVILELNADTDNVDESHNPMHRYTQDGTTNTMNIGAEGVAGSQFTGSTGNHGYIQVTNAHSGSIGLEIATNNIKRLTINSQGHVVPGADNTYNLGTATSRWANIYSADIHCSNKGSSNDVDGTWGDFTIQEGESDLFLINNRSGKKYKFNLTEVN